MVITGSVLFVSSSARWGLSPLGLCGSSASSKLPTCWGLAPRTRPPQAPRVRPRKEGPEVSVCQASPGDGDSAATCAQGMPHLCVQWTRPAPHSLLPSLRSHNPALPRPKGQSAAQAQTRPVGPRLPRSFWSSVSFSPFSFLLPQNPGLPSFLTPSPAPLPASPPPPPPKLGERRPQATPDPPLAGSHSRTRVSRVANRLVLGTPSPLVHPVHGSISRRCPQGPFVPQTCSQQRSVSANALFTTGGVPALEGAKHVHGINSNGTKPG